MAFTSRTSVLQIAESYSARHPEADINFDREEELNKEPIVHSTLGAGALTVL
jgi:hypothetical protein